MYARLIVFSDTEGALRAIDKIASIHKAVESNRGAQIPDWAYRDVLFMLIHYSIASYELLERKLTHDEKEDVFDVFFRVGDRMGLRGLPHNYKEWAIMHAEHLEQDLQKSHYTTDLYKQYRKHLGFVRYEILKESQKLVVPPRVNQLLRLGKPTWVVPLLWIYKKSRKVRMDGILKSLILPQAYKKQIKELDIA